MLDEKRVRLMTQMASYEETDGRKMIPVTTWFRSDYVGFNMVKSALSITIVYVLVVGTYIFCNVEKYIADFYKTDFMSLLRRFLSIYAVVTIAYLLVAFLLYTYRYNKARKSVRTYQRALSLLLTMYHMNE
ncbi:MAG: hypothetical protein K5985_06455 [Lachnospiraceae bacterium]|nr:hypothetical protein [Lachnospiraceae bacterium]